MPLEWPLVDIYQRCKVVVSDPVSFDEASQSKTWRKAVKIDINMTNKNQTWKLVDKSKGEYAIGVRSIFITKYIVHGSVNKYKVGLVVKEYVQ